LSRVLSGTAEGAFQMKNSARSSQVAESADGRGLVSQAGAVLLWEAMRVTGPGRGLSGMRVIVRKSGSILGRSCASPTSLGVSRYSSRTTGMQPTWDQIGLIGHYPLQAGTIIYRILMLSCSNAATAAGTQPLFHLCGMNCGTCIV
jgi:hypothetical protein